MRTRSDDARGVGAIANATGCPDLRPAAVAGAKSSGSSSLPTSLSTAHRAAGSAADGAVAVDARSAISIRTSRASCSVVKSAHADRYTETFSRNRSQCKANVS